MVTIAPLTLVVVGAAAAVCGDGIIQAPNDAGDTETCDDGNSTGGDGCNDRCGTEIGWSCSGEPSICNIDYANICSGADRTYIPGTTSSGCWVLGAQGDNCDTACSNVLIDVNDSTSGLSCVAGYWNADAAICSGLSLNTPQSTTVNATYAPYSVNSSCQLRDESLKPNQDCAAEGIIVGPDVEVQRICECK